MHFNIVLLLDIAPRSGFILCGLAGLALLCEILGLRTYIRTALRLLGTYSDRMITRFRHRVPIKQGADGTRSKLGQFKSICAVNSDYEFTKCLLQTLRMAMLTDKSRQDLEVGLLRRSRR